MLFDFQRDVYLLRKLVDDLPHGQDLINCSHLPPLLLNLKFVKFLNFLRVTFFFLILYFDLQRLSGY